MNVKEVRIYSAFPTWLQIAEVVATQTGTGSDVALASQGASATSSSNYSGTTPGKAIDGIYPAAYPNIWHSGGTGAGEYLDIKIGRAHV
jgi:hypothetical protein